MCRQTHFCYCLSLRFGSIYAIGYILMNYVIVRAVFGVWMLIRAESLPTDPGIFQLLVRIMGLVFLVISTLGLMADMCLAVAVVRRVPHFLIPALILIGLIFLLEIVGSLIAIVFWNGVNKEQVVSRSQLDKNSCDKNIEISYTPSREEVLIQTYTSIWNLLSTISAFYLWLVVYSYYKELMSRLVRKKVAVEEHQTVWGGRYHSKYWEKDVEIIPGPS